MAHSPLWPLNREVVGVDGNKGLMLEISTPSNRYPQAFLIGLPYGNVNMAQSIQDPMEGVTRHGIHYQEVLFALFFI